MRSYGVSTNIPSSISGECFHCDGTGKIENEIPKWVMYAILVMLTDSRHRKVEAISFLRNQVPAARLPIAKRFIEGEIIPFIEAIEKSNSGGFREEGEYNLHGKNKYDANAST